MSNIGPPATVIPSFLIRDAKQYQEPDPRNWKIHRNKKGWPRWYQRWLEAWWIIRGKWSLHMAWQDGIIHGSRGEWNRIYENGGDAEAIVERWGDKVRHEA